MIYGHLEREHPWTTVAAQVHFKGSKVLITQGKQLKGTPSVANFVVPNNSTKSAMLGPYFGCPGSLFGPYVKGERGCNEL